MFFLLLEHGLVSASEGKSACFLSFSFDKALTNEFSNCLFAFLDKEKRRDEVNQRQQHCLDEDPSSNQEWIKSHDKLLKKVNWKHIAAWFHLFTSAEQAKGKEILAQLENLKQSLISLIYTIMILAYLSN